MTRSLDFYKFELNMLIRIYDDFLKYFIKFSN